MLSWRGALRIAAAWRHRWAKAAAAVVLAGFFQTIAPAAHAGETACHGLTGKMFGDAVIYETEQISAPISLSSNAGSRNRGTAISQPFCRIRGLAKPVKDSEIRFEVWLPETGRWNSRLQAVGNGGFAGNFAYANMAWALEGGYAVAATDTGHTGSSADSSWALGHPEKIVDLGWRAMHETTVAAKAIIASYYGKAPAHSYYAGCSTGGRQGLVLAQRFPEDYDGIAVGAPAYNWPSLLAFGASKYKLLMDDASRWISPAKFKLINDASLKACHAANGLIDDPGSCRFDPGALLCRKGQTAQCLSAGEVAMARFLYDGIRDTSGKSIYPGFTPGLERAWELGSEGAGGRDSWAYAFPSGFYANLVHQDSAWTIAQFDLNKDLSEALNGPVGAAMFSQDPNLAPFFARGGKLIQYHGWHDQAIPANSSLMYYRSVLDRMGGLAAVQPSYRLFFGTGMTHCGGGPGPNVIGGASGSPPSRDAEHDVIAAVRRWVEEGIAPSKLIATRYVDNDRSKGVEMQRPWCPWPAAPRYKGGDRNRAESYSCVQSHERKR